MTWSRTMALGLLLWPLGCVVTVSDDPDGFGGTGGTFDGESGAAGAGATGGSAGSSGSSGAAGDSAGGAGGSGSFPAPTCEAEPEDTGDECVICLKQYCCDEWLACDDEGCASERVDVAECVQADPAADADTLGMCISDSSAAGDGLVQANTQALIECTTRLADDAGFDTLCSSECFNVDIFFE